MGLSSSSFESKLHFRVLLVNDGLPLSHTGLRCGDATKALLCDIFVLEESATDEAQVLDVLGACTDTDKLSDIVLDCLEKAIVSGQISELQSAVDQLAHHVLACLVDSIPEAFKLLQLAQLTTRSWSTFKSASRTFAK
ncbi:hypothetical protein Pmar_PMAR011251 [Perkinsus marinus ATCC 50983]|uniref:Uncharacterized protein n=1 Tax=Perkinsus marinus (strain ATCC 50983 / TXsc) TaxID=423536 RepID=C5LJC2_PERM5|nr:hypothetical protein Pmar_PMAR011251 [Perkinsus marinus ATCC 50983]EER03171.1 hypothetical protein Pmar_PMAR011251 [Perkinsus marinus ATCC 50983]|eukprot:XP_002771355.1 hypothetical protein Pmar_PMAR011251 [Perkinsus marinus ATCC 50983]